MCYYSPHSYKMGKNCVAAGCSNTHKKGISLFKFPTDKHLRIRQVQRTRDKWKGPSEYSCICSQHFTEDCFEPMSVMSSKVGVKMNQPDAVPTIFPCPNDAPIPKRAPAVFEKRERARVYYNCQNICDFRFFYQCSKKTLTVGDPGSQDLESEIEVCGLLCM